MDSEVFLDTAYAIALANAKDQFHSKAVEVAKQLRIHKTKLVTTRRYYLRSEMHYQDIAFERPQ